MQIAGIGISRIKTGDESSIWVTAQRFEVFDDVAHGLDYDLGRERDGCRYGPR